MADKKPSGGVRQVFSFDTSEFAASLKRLVTQVEPEATGRGLFAAGNELLRDAIQIPPQAPKEFGDLWGSARVTRAEIHGDQAEVQAGFNIEYAARWHEVPLSMRVNWTTDKGSSSPGPKYLETKLVQYREKYMVIVGNYLARALAAGTAKAPAGGGV